MKAGLFRHELASTASTFGRAKTPLKVVVSGKGAWTDGENVNLPTFDESKDINPAEQRYIRGYLDHEAGHVRHTDFEEINRRLVDLKAKGVDEEAVGQWFNVCEDLRIEKLVMDDYPGARRNLTETAAQTNRMATEKFDEMNDLSKLRLGVVWAGRKDYSDGTGEELLKRLDPQMRKMCETLAKKALSCKSTADCLDVAEKVVELLSSEPEEPDAPEGKAPGEGDEDGEQEAGEQETGQAGDEDGDDKQEDAGEGEDEGGEDEGEGEAQGDEDASEDEDEGASDIVMPGFSMSKDGEDVSEDDLKRTVLKNACGTGGGKYTVRSTAFDVFKKWDLSDARNQGGIDVYNGFRAKAIQSAAKTQGVLTRKLLSTQQRTFKGGYEVGRLDSRRLVAAVGGASNVYKRRSDAHDINTAVTLLVDLSGSMEGDKLNKALEATIIMVEGLERAGVACEVLGHCYGPYQVVRVIPDTERDRMFKDVSAEIYSRAAPIFIREYKPFDKTVRQCRGTLGHMLGDCDGANADGEALLFAAGRLLKRPEPKKVLIVLSDGEPATDRRRDAQWHLKQVTQQLEAEPGLELAALGICDDSPKDYYTRHAVVYDASELPEALTKILDSTVGKDVAVA